MKEEVLEAGGQVGFELPNEVVYVKYIPRKKGMAANVPDDHVIAGGMMGEAVRKFRAPLTKSGAIANVLTNEEKKFLEDVTQLKLSVYGDFWVDFAVTLYKEESNNRLDLSNSIDYMKYKLLLACKNTIAPSWSQRDAKLTYQFAIVRGGEEDKEAKKGLDAKKEAFKLYGKIEDDKDKLVGVLRLLSNKPISSDSKLDWIQGRVEEKLDESPKAFLDIVKDESFDTKILIFKGIEYGVIKRNGTQYGTADGLDLCESGEIPTYDNAVRFLENPRNQDIRSLVEAKINNAE